MPRWTTATSSSSDEDEAILLAKRAKQRLKEAKKRRLAEQNTNNENDNDFVGSERQQESEEVTEQYENVNESDEKSNENKSHFVGPQRPPMDDDYDDDEEENEEPFVGPSRPPAVEDESSNESNPQNLDETNVQSIDTNEPLFDPSEDRPCATGPPLIACRSVDYYEKLNRIDEGAYGVVYRARDSQTQEIVALKRLKLDREKEGFPITSLREIHTLLLAKHPHIVNVREIVVGRDMGSVFMVMDFIEHDLKSLLEDMRQPFTPSEVKTLLSQLLQAVHALHSRAMVHRDLKTSNLLLTNTGHLKLADFGLARKYSSPPGPMTQLVVTLWYRPPELLMGEKTYSTAVDMWGIGCIFAELISKRPLFPGRSELDQLDRIFRILGMPNDHIWPGFSQLPYAPRVKFNPVAGQGLRDLFPQITPSAMDLLKQLLAYDPNKRISAENAMKHPYFSELPPGKDPSLFPTWPSKGGGERRRHDSPSAPVAHVDIDDEPFRPPVSTQRLANEPLPLSVKGRETFADLKTTLTGESMGLRLKRH